MVKSEQGFGKLDNLRNKMIHLGGTKSTRHSPKESFSSAWAEPQQTKIEKKTEAQGTHYSHEQQ